MLRLAPRTGGWIEVVAGPMFSGKSAAAGTEVLLADGRTVKVEDVEVGDRLMGDDSAPRTVLAVSTGEEEMYEVAPSYGEPHVFTPEHVLSLKCCHSPGWVSYERKTARVKVTWLEEHVIQSRSFPLSRHGGSPERAISAARTHLATVTRTPVGAKLDIELRDYLSRPKSWRRLYKGYAVAVELPPQSLLIDPYLLGVWLGDGNSGGPGFTTADPEIVAALAHAADAYGLQLSRYKGIHYGITAGTANNRRDANPFLASLHDLRLVSNKHIPDAYKRGSRAQRLALLAGLVDTDGWYDRHRHGVEITLVNERLARDTVFVARTLGLRALVSSVQKTCTNGTNGPVTGIYWRISLSGDHLHELPTQIARKRIAPHRHLNDLLVSLTVRPVGRGRFHGFMLDGNGRYLLADCTVTHNSEELLRRIRREEIAGKKLVVFKPGVDDRWGAGRKVVSRAGTTIEAMPITRATEALTLAEPFEVVGFDEAQFFGSDLVEVCSALANAGKRVIVAGLDTDFRQRPFGSMAELLAVADYVDKVQAVCHRCGAPASFTQRLVDGKPAPFSGDTVVVGSDEYEARCRACFQPA